MTRIRLRQWLSALAILGVLAHASAIVRHSVSMATAAPVQATADSLMADLTSICHGNGDLSKAADDKPQQAPAKPACPLCSGLAPVATLPASDQAPLFCPRQRGMRLVAGDVELAVFASIRPNSRGPPTI